MIRTIGLDPATCTGWAYQHNGRWLTGDIFFYRGYMVDAAACLRETLVLARERGVRIAVVEDCYISRSWQTAKRLSEIQGIVCEAAQAAGLELHRVSPATWQCALLCVGRASREERKRAAYQYALRIGAEPTSQDQADAICLAEYGRLVSRQTELTLVGPRGGTFKIRSKK